MRLTYDDRRIELGGATLEAPYPVTGATVLDDVAVVRLEPRRDQLTSAFD